jgi:hypothetical protein
VTRRLNFALKTPLRAPAVGAIIFPLASSTGSRHLSRFCGARQGLWLRANAVVLPAHPRRKLEDSLRSRFPTFSEVPVCFNIHRCPSLARLFDLPPVQLGISTTFSIIQTLTQLACVDPRRVRVCGCFSRFIRRHNENPSPIWILRVRSDIAPASCPKLAMLPVTSTLQLIPRKRFSSVSLFAPESCTSR